MRFMFSRPKEFADWLFDNWPQFAPSDLYNMPLVEGMVAVCKLADVPVPPRDHFPFVSVLGVLAMQIEEKHRREQFTYSS